MATITDLPRETLAAIVSYLTFKEKRIVACVNRRCVRAVGDGLRHVVLNPSDPAVGMNLNLALQFVRRACHHLEHLSLEVPEKLMLQGEEDFEGQWFLPSVPTLQLAGQFLDTTISICSPTLKSLRLRFEENCHTKVLRILQESDGLRCVATCRSLKVLQLEFVTFSSMEHLTAMLTPLSQTLVGLRLDNISFGSLPLQRSWPSSFLLAHTIQKMTCLEQLSLECHHFRDADVKIMLGPHSKCLRSLALPRHVSFAEDISSGLSDASMNAIAQKCPHLQLLEIGNNPRVTPDGCKEVLTSCPLIALLTPLCGIEESDWKDLATLSSTLRFVMCQSGFFSNFAGSYSQMIGHLADAIVASQGQVLVSHALRGLIQTETTTKTLTLQQRECTELISRLVKRQKQTRERGETDTLWMGSSFILGRLVCFFHP